MEVYKLTSIGETLAHSYRAPDTAKWRVVFFLKNGARTKEHILESVPSATPYTLGELRRKGIIISNEGVMV
jgi:hypothetical protein